MSLRLATELGYTILTDPTHPISAEAARLLPLTHPALGIDVSDTVAHIAFDHIPTGAELQALERTTGRLVAASVCTPTTLTALKARCASEREGATDILHTLASMSPDVTQVTLTPGRPPQLDQRASTGPLLSETAVEAFIEWAGATPDTSTTCTLAAQTWRVCVYNAGGTRLVDLHKVAAWQPAPTAAIPRQLADLDTISHGLVLLAAPLGHGRSTLLHALASRAHQRLSVDRPATLAHIHSELPPAGLLQAGTTHHTVGIDYPSVAEAIAAATTRRTRILAVDVDRYTGADVEQLLAAALSGTLVYATIPGNDLTTALAALLLSVDDSTRHATRAGLAAAFQAGLAQQLHPGTSGVVPILETWWRNPSLVAGLLEAPLTSLRALDRDSASTAAKGTTMDDALAAARSAGLIT